MDFVLTHVKKPSATPANRRNVERTEGFGYANQPGAALLTLPILLVAMDTTALLLALPRLSAGLGASNVQQLWISDSYGLLVAGLVITMGTLGDRIGHRRLLIIGAAAFAVLPVVAGRTDPSSPYARRPSPPRPHFPITSASSE
jgi:hypothetical protein